MAKELFLIGGVSGSGKSSLAATLAQPEDVVVAADDYFMVDGEYCYNHDEIQLAHAWCFKVAEDAVKEGKRVFVTNTFTSAIHTAPYHALACEYGYRVFDLVVLNTHGNDDVHGVPLETKIKQHENLVGRINLTRTTWSKET